jgi:hypothetical protein
MPNDISHPSGSQLNSAFQSFTANIDESLYQRNHGPKFQSAVPLGRTEELKYAQGMRRSPTCSIVSGLVETKNESSPSAHGIFFLASRLSS